MKKFAWVVLLIALGVYFLQDEALTPLAERALNYQPAPVPAEQNAFVGIAGFNALAGRDFIQMGEAYIRNAHLGQANQQDEQNFDYREKEYSYSCAKELTENCLNEIRADAKNIQKLQEAEQELIQRYLKIQEMPEYSNPIFPPSVYAVGNMVLPRFDYLTYISRILSAQAILDIKNGRVSKGLNWFQKDMAFYRRVFAAKDADLIEKMIALVQLRNHAMLLRLLIEEGGLRGQNETLRARLEYQLAAKNSHADPLKILAALPPETFNPYTEKPFDFDAERGVIGFQPVANADKEKPIEIRLFNPPQP